MNPTTEEPVFYKTPDGVERRVRYHLGAEKRICDHFKMSLKAALDLFDKAALPAILYFCMYGPGGVPPEKLSLVEFEETVDPAEAPAMMATLITAMSKGKASKNEVEALIRARMSQQMEALIGFASGPSLDSASGSQITSSGGSLQPNLENSSTAGETTSEQTTPVSG